MPGGFKKYTVAAVLGWTLCIALLYCWDRYNLTRESLELARIQARAVLYKDMLYRKWNSLSMGLYVPLSERTPPNPYLSHIPGRDLTTASGRRLTLVNPSYMMRQVNELQKSERGVLGHITSLKPLRPDNAPDPWESRALKKFEQGKPEASSVEEIYGKPYMRLMLPLVAEKSCLKCHASQGYRVGDIRGGISVSVPLQPLLDVVEFQKTRKLAGYGLLWVLGIAMITFGTILMTSEARAVQKSEKLLKTITGTATDAIIMVDGQACVSFWNHAAEEMFGYSKEEALGREIHLLALPPRYHNAFRSRFGRFLENSKVPASGRTLEFMALHREGVEFPVQMSVSGVMLDGRQYGVCILRDITLQRQSQEELRRARDFAEEANRAKSEFLANISHEIRTPMHGIIGMTDIALSTDLSTEQRECLETVRQSSETLYGLLNDILDLSKIESGNLEFERVDFDLLALVESAAAVHALEARRKGIELILHVLPGTPGFLKGDPTRLKQVLMNLLSNAVKFTESGEVVVRVWLPGGQGTNPDTGLVQLCFSVSDTGPGIPGDKQCSIFNRFRQVDSSTTRRHGGTGLGLAISKHIVELMGGTICVESKLGEGSTFRFSAEFALGRPPEAEAGRAGTVDMEGARVMVVDGNDTCRDILIQTLREWGAAPTGAKDAGQALDGLRKAAGEAALFSLVILDSRIPGTDGFRLAEIIRGTPGLEGTALLMLVPAHMTGTAAGSGDAAHAFLKKPVKQRELLAAAMDALGRRVSSHPQGESKGVESLGPSFNILVVEDNAVNLKIATRILRKAGHSIRVAKNGVEALEAASRELFHLILMDVQMPEMDGLEATRRIRASAGDVDPGVKIIAMTARAMKGDREACLEAGMDGYVSKPIKAAELLDAVRSALLSPERA